jgi:transglutaminase-like putative cysteine protease
MGSTHVRYWQLAAFLAAILPQYDRLPVWLLAFVVLSCVWRLPKVEHHIHAPGMMLRLLMLGAGLAGVVVSHKTLLGPEGGVSFLILVAALKLLESRNARDIFVLGILDFFILATAFLFSQSLLLTIYVGLALVVVVSALLVQQQRQGVSVRRTAWRSAVMVGQTIPLILILFVFFPRLPPIWTLNLTQGSGKTGMSDIMSPGDLVSLGQSSEPAFRVEFEGKAPPARELYWRGLVFSRFDGRTWTQGNEVPVDWGDMSADWMPTFRENAQFAIRYKVTLEASDKPWLFALEFPQSNTKDVGLSRDYRLLKRTPVFSRFSYDVVSYPNVALDSSGLPPWIHKENIELPVLGNEQTKAQARRWRNTFGNDASFVRHVLEWFRKEPFYYTLEPPPLRENRIDEFLFKSRRGFCEHYASSFVFMMRAAGIPARVVVGYQGGEESSLGDYWQVRQMDAHAWAEVWLPGRGWVGFDPTAAVAPERVEKGAQGLANDLTYWGGSGLGLVRYSNYKLFRQARQMIDYINYRWQQDILNYDTDDQSSLMRRLLGDSSLLKQLGVMAGLLVMLAVGVLLWMLYGQQRPAHPIDRMYRRYCQRLARLGLVRAPGENPEMFASRVAVARPKEALRAKEVARLYMALRYRPERPEAGVLTRRLRRLTGWY